MSAKFKPKKKEAEPIVDDWEAADSVEDEESISSKLTSSSTNIGRAHQDAWEEEKGGSSSLPPKVDGRTLWQEANREAPQPQPLLSNRSLPPTVLSPRLYNPSSSSSSGEYQHAVTAPPPPQILRREKVQYSSNANDRNNEKKKTMKEREEEYKRARERIFGSSSKSASETSLQQRQSPSADSTGNKNRDTKTKS